MAKSLITDTSKFLGAISIIHSGIAIGLVILAWGIL